jgi:hypothetical protein
MELFFFVFWRKIVLRAVEEVHQQQPISCCPVNFLHVNKDVRLFAHEI